MVFQNFLYCNGTGSLAPISGSYYTTGTRGSALTDIINIHAYEGSSGTPERLAKDVPAFTAVLSAKDFAKPFWSGGGGWGPDTSPPPQFGEGETTDCLNNQAAFMDRYYLVGWSTKVLGYDWYGYSSTCCGTLWNSSGGLNLAGIDWGTAYKWVVGSTLTTPCSASGTVWTCELTLANGTAAEAIWDTSQICSDGTCTTSNQNVSTIWTN